MFKVTSQPVFTHTVRVQVPTNGDGHEVQSFKATFKVLPLEDEDAVPRNSKDVLLASVCGMSDLTDDNDEALTYSEELRDQMIALPYVRIAMFDAYVKGVSKAPAGN